MTELATIPTTREEDWRYSDGAYLAAADPAAIRQWRTLDVPAGDTHGESFTFLEDTSGTERLRVSVGAGGTFSCFAAIASGRYRRLELEVTLAEGAHFEFGGVTVGGGDAVQEFVTRVIHAEPHGTSNQVVRAVQWGKSTGNFLGRIEVVRDAQKTDAAQNFRALLLEKGAASNTKPELEIFADDVKCAHGAAIGALDDSAAFYMAARGLPPEVA
ncbi:MAG: SufD family Fe-S cluster assembly protein, partial [Allopontixanthobacter sediminis]